MTDGVILLHGIFRTKWSMRALEKFLKKEGFSTLNIGYRSTKHHLEEIIDAIHPQIEKFAANHQGRIHFIGYSMGGLVIRAYLHKYRPENLGRVVMLGTPNQGSEMADLVADWRFYKWSYGPAGQQLVTTQDAFKHIFGTVNYELGILAGNLNLDPLAAWLIRKPNDGKVSVESTKIEGMTDHAILRVTHTFFPSNRKAWSHTIKFLQDGRF